MSGCGNDESLDSVDTVDTGFGISDLYTPRVGSEPESLSRVSSVSTEPSDRTSKPSLGAPVSKIERDLQVGDLLTVPQAQKLMPVGRSTLYALIESGDLPHYRVGAGGCGMTVSAFLRSLDERGLRGIVAEWRSATRRRRR